MHPMFLRIQGDTNHHMENRSHNARRLRQIDSFGGFKMTCPECHSLDQELQAFTEKEQLRILVFKCLDCGCLFALKTEVEVLEHSRT